MTIKLQLIESDNIFCIKDIPVLYGDFYVLNYLYEQRFNLSDTCIIYPDSTAIYVLLKYFFKYKIKKLVSTDLQEELIATSSLLKKSIFFFGDNDAVLSEVIKNIKQNFGGVKIAGVQNGFSFPDGELIDRLNTSGADILLVGLGATRQEKWINDNFRRVNIPVIISVGGWFQYLAGIKIRAPRYLRYVHLEWLYKLCNDFRRVWYRYFIILPIFIIRVLLHKIDLELKQ